VLPVRSSLSHVTLTLTLTLTQTLALTLAPTRRAFHTHLTAKSASEIEERWDCLSFKV
jgi:hypothetical protein